MDYCEFGEDRLCVTCGHPLQKSASLTVRRACPYRRGTDEKTVRRDCPHLLDHTTDSVVLKNCGCGAMSTVYECAVYNLCAPHPRNKNAVIIDRDDVRLCLNCEKNPANQGAAT